MSFSFKALKFLSYIKEHGWDSESTRIKYQSRHIICFFRRESHLQRFTL
jgi:hypothetical protein